MAITVSIVSHGQGVIALHAINQLRKFSPCIKRVVFTHNIKEDVEINVNDYPFELIIINNKKPMGFGANHNQAFSYCNSAIFCVMNPDISFEFNPFPDLLNGFNDETVAIVAPLVKSPDGSLEDSARYFPTPMLLLKKLFFNKKGTFPIDVSKKHIESPWIAGMFLLFDADKYKQLSGFDEDYFLYYEDVDICARSWKKGFKVLLSTTSSVIHDARRSSHKNFKYMRWHLNSILTFFLKHPKGLSKL